MTEADAYTTIVEPFIKERIKRLREAGFNPNEPGHRQAFITFPPMGVYLAQELVKRLLQGGMHTLLTHDFDFTLKTTTTLSAKEGFVTEILISYPGLVKGQTP